MKELVRRRVDVIVAPGPEIALQSAVAEASDVPIVMVAIDYDPVAKGYVKSLARPGGPVTGVVALQVELTRKRFQLLKDALPNIQGVTVLWDHISADQWRIAKEVAATLGMHVFAVELRNPPYDYEAALASAPRDHRAVVMSLATPVMFPDRVRFCDILLRQEAASMHAFREYAVAGGLFSYGPSLPAMFVRAADFVVRIAKGAKPADMPVEQPTKFEFLINMKTAKALGLTLPSGILAIADEVAE
jgi:putative ABC transport system substrate-binding protein